MTKIVLAIADQELHSEVLRICAAAGRPTVDCMTPGQLGAQARRARSIIVDATGAGWLADLDKGALAGTGAGAEVVYVVDDAAEVDWKKVCGCRAAGTVALPAKSGELLRFLRESPEKKKIPGLVIGVCGVTGGAGASTFAAALACAAAKRLVTKGALPQPVLLVDGCPVSGGLDLLVGLEETKGLRWAALIGAAGGGKISLLDVAAVVPTTRDGVAVLTASRPAHPTGITGPGADEVAAAIDGIRTGSGIGIVDLPAFGPGMTQHMAGLVDHLVVLVPGELRAAAAARSVAADIAARGVDALPVLRWRGWAGLGADELAEMIGWEFITELRTVRGLAKTLELTGLPQTLPKGLGRPAGVVLDTVGLLPAQRTAATVGMGAPL